MNAGGEGHMDGDTIQGFHQVHVFLISQSESIRSKGHMDAQGQAASEERKNEVQYTDTDCIMAGRQARHSHSYT